MTDQHRITAPVPHHRAGPDHYKLTSTALWIGLVAGTALNLGLQAVGLWVLAVPFGAIAAFSGIALVLRAVVTGKRR